MNNTRIRYVKQADGSLKSMQIFKSHLSPGEYYCIISADGKTGKVIDALTHLQVDKVVGTSAHKTKIALKKTLKTLNVIFLNEKREKQYGQE